MLASVGGSYAPLVVSDPFFEYVTMLLPGNGTNGGQNNTFLDSSTNNFTITRNGNTTQGTFSPYGSNWSNYFDGSSTLYFAGTPISTTESSFTIEAWVYATATPTFGGGVGQVVVDGNGTGGGSYWGFGLNTSNNILFRWYTGSGFSCVSTGTVPLNQWTHIAVSVSSNAITLYINGTQQSVTGTTTLSNRAGNQGYINIGRYATTDSFYGYISNARITTGASLYTSSFTPSTTPLTTTVPSGTVQFLSCQSNRFLDTSSSARAPLIAGIPSVQRFSPFNPTASYATATIGGSGYFDGSGDYLSVPNSSNFSMGSGNFTCEFWVYVPSNPSVNYPSIVGPQSVANYGIGVRYGNTGYANKFTVHLYGTGSWVGDPLLASSSTYPLSAWHHVAVTRSGTTMTLWVNGASAASTTSSANVDFSSNGQALWIGDSFDGASGYFNGYISDLRIVKGTAVYTSAFTPPTAPVTAITNTSLLTNFTNGSIIDNAMMNNLETVGNAQISTSVSKFGGGSMAFDGSGDRLTIPYTNDFLDVGVNGQNFTIEAWIYPTNAMASTGQILSKGGGAASWSTSNGAQYQWSITSSALSWQFNSGGSPITVNGGSVTLNSWQHVAVTFDGTTTRTFLNGVVQSTSTSNYTAPTTRNVQYIGMTQSIGFTQEYFGNIDDLRITKGYARYTSNFTPPTAAFPTF
jgi:hypothetical protein